jgi:hypothetical protein
LVNAATKTREAQKPWDVCRKPDGTPDKLYEPGWAGEIDPEETERLQQALAADKDLAFSWGWRPGMKRRSLAAIERVAAHGDPENRGHNVKLVREVGRRAKADTESASPRVKKG